MVQKVSERNKFEAVLYAKDRTEAESHLRDIVQPNDVVVVMGAGPIDNLARKLAGQEL